MHDPTALANLDFMHICSRLLLRPFAHSRGSCAGALSIPVFLLPSIASRASGGTHRSCPQQDRTSYGHGRLLTTAPARHRTLSFAEGISAISYGQDNDRTTGRERFSRTVQPTTSLELQDEAPRSAAGKLNRPDEPAPPMGTTSHHERGSQPSIGGSRIGLQESVTPDDPDSDLDPSGWISQIEASLPNELRTQDADISEKSPLSIVGLVTTLKQARMLHNLDILSHLGVHMGRWQAVVWIVRKILDGSPVSHAYAFDALPAEYHQMTIKNPALCSGERPDWLALNEALGQVWSSLGSMIIAASEGSAKERKDIMSHVLQIIAYIHHIDCIPNSLYNYTYSTQSSNQSLFQRPPTLHLLSSRILAALSDAVWRAHEQHIAAEAATVGAQYTYMGHEVPGARYRLKIRELGPEVWMELILWCCVEAGFITEGAWIIGEMEKRPSIHKWSFLSWNAIQDSDAAVAGLQASAVDWDRVKRRTGGVVGRIEGYSAERPFVEVGERTLSSEVVVALIDGLVNAIFVSDPRQDHSSMHILDLIITLNGLLDRESHGSGIPSYNQVILHILNAAGLRAQTNTRLLERVLSLAPSHGVRTEVLHPQRRKPSNHNKAGQHPDNSAIVGYVLQRLLGLYARSGHINACLHVWSRLQDVVDSAKLTAIEDFFARLKLQSAAGDEDRYFSQGPLDYLKPHLHYKIPTPILADFLNVITENQESEFGKWLLYSHDADGPVIPESIYSNVFLAPALVNFASATSDVELLSKIISKAPRPFSTDMMKALLRCEIDLHRWDSVEDILGFIRSRRKYRWTELEFVKLVVAVMRLERDISADVAGVGLMSKAVSLKRAKAILSKLMNGTFGRPKPPNEYHWSDHKYMNLLRYMVHTVLPSHIDIRHGFSESWNPEDTRFLATTTFNTLLKGIIETQGSKRGRYFWDLWCRPPGFADVDAGFDSRITPPSRFPVLEHSDEGTMFEGSSRRLGAAQLDLLYTSWRVKQTRHLERRRAGKSLRPNIGTLRIIIQAALKEEAGARGFSRYDPPKEQASTLGQSSVHRHSISADSDLDSIFVWGREMFRRFGLDEREIDHELGIPTNTSDV
ncbi:hypothetical protein GP486_004789 [Trichoglossum hirsutum]|uniref:Uncharacterized protein n=1 Tax=Trichoglossum hirsutum TaxID=265104 RepID=A0A9P8LAH2_9PEZI|nr:hypothetical protein GP486_004789 [Trichoglossum hirsutum]